MAESREKRITIELLVEVTNQLELRDAGFIAARQGQGAAVELGEEAQSAVNTALLTLLRYEPKELPGARITNVSISIADDNRRERWGWPPLEPDPSAP
ncbi:hypothetical protein [Geodermatophilus sabuli]|uniref:Uncharacterized protein n=1 Tax=Geodermatophilus sabuli TaxID=1564158 RepID=A0A285EG16_9ACTN|nr:hypothetical protein [Geodermatophilus sabuli]MBB3082941.1 hypothetical protein [Geodermatophilus sabuli]SNX97940.1 hypothetical protein SAMN06893097_10920 [Geodermatophilus sabuli]